jgi:hypothetical protein
MAAISGEGNYSSFDVLKVILSSQRDAIRGLPRSRFLLLATVNLLPLVLVGIRWSGTKASYRVSERIISEGAVILLQLGWLGTAVYMAFDSAFSQRQLIHLDPQYNGIPLLTFHFCGAIAAGYFLGYFLLVGGSEPSKAWDRPSPGLQNLTRLGWVIMIVAGPGGSGGTDGSELASYPGAERTAPGVLRPGHCPGFAEGVFPGVLGQPLGAFAADRVPDSAPVLLATPAGQRLPRTTALVPAATSAGSTAADGLRSRNSARRPRMWPRRFLALLREAAAMERAFIVAPEVSFITDRFELRPIGLLFRLQPFGDKAVDPTPLSDRKQPHPDLLIGRRVPRSKPYAVCNPMRFPG